jgi:hypothetical protein
MELEASRKSIQIRREQLNLLLAAKQINSVAPINCSPPYLADANDKTIKSKEKQISSGLLIFN